MAGLISPATIETVRAANDIVEVIGGYMPLKRAGGANFVALCPFHKEKTPSFHVNPHRQIFHCFGCHKGGDVFTFVKEYESVGFTDAVRRLAERARIPLEFDTRPGDEQARHVKDLLLQVHEQITQRWHAALVNEASGQMAREYLAGRGVSEEAVKLFRLGCAPDLWDDTVNWARSKGHELALVERAGLILRKEGGEHFYDRFRGRLIFPICDEQGRVIGFSGRILSGDEKTAKYVNSPETPLFTKSKVMFGLDKTKRALLDAHSAIVCEGQLDLIACFMAGVKNVIAPQGTALTADHARILKRYVDEVVLCFDSDTAGQNAAVRSLDSLLAAGLAVRVATMPAPHDPDSFIKQSGGAAFQELIDRAESFFDYYLDRLCATNDLGTDKGRVNVLSEFKQMIRKTRNEVLIDTYAQKAAMKLGVTSQAVRAEFSKSVTAKTSVDATAEDDDSTREKIGTISAKEFLLLKILLESDDGVEWLQQRLNLAWINSPVVRNIVERRFELERNSCWKNTAAFVTGFEDSAIQEFLTEILMGGIVQHTDGLRYSRKQGMIRNPIEELSGALTQMREDYINREVSRLSGQMTQPNLSTSEQAELLRTIQQLRELKRQPLTPDNP